MMDLSTDFNALAQASYVCADINRVALLPFLFAPIGPVSIRFVGKTENFNAFIKKVFARFLTQAA